MPGGMKTVVLTILCLVDKTTVFPLILLIIEWLRLLRGINRSQNWIHILSPELLKYPKGTLSVLCMQ